MLIRVRIRKQRSHGFDEAEADDLATDLKRRGFEPVLVEAVRQGRRDVRTAVDQSAVAVENGEPVHREGSETNRRRALRSFPAKARFEGITAFALAESVTDAPRGGCACAPWLQQRSAFALLRPSALVSECPA